MLAGVALLTIATAIRSYANVCELHTHVRVVAAPVELDDSTVSGSMLSDRERGRGVEKVPADVVAPVLQEFMIAGEEVDGVVPLPLRALQREWARAERVRDGAT